MFLPIIGLLVASSFVQSAKILGVCTIPSVSHQVVFHPIWRELSSRGHQVTVLTPDPLNDPKLVNLTEISINDAYFMMTKHQIPTLSSKNSNKLLYAPNVYAFLNDLTEFQFNNTEFKRLMADKNQTFDVILAEAYYPAWHALSAKFNAPIIGIASLDLPIPQHDSVGNPTHPVLYPDYSSSLYGELSLRDKIFSSFYNMWYRSYYEYVAVPEADQLARKYFGNDLPYVGDLERNVSMWFINVSPLLHAIRPTVPAIIQMGQMHLQPIKPLPQDLQQILDEATEGLVYFSLGSNVKSVDIADQLRKTILSALSALPYKILWKFEADHLPGKAPNIITRKWLPQQDVLAHPNVKVFVTQGGLQSIEESITNGVPMVGIPFMADQPINVEAMVKLGLGIGLDHNTLTKAVLEEAIKEVAVNSKYKRRVEQVRDILNDQPMTGLERAIWWTEYVIRHKNVRHLRSPTVDMPWYYYYLLDVIAAISAAVFVVFAILTRIIKTLLPQKFNKKLKTS